MKVLWVSDFGIHHNYGGAQRSNDIVVKEGISRGHDITCFHYDSPSSLLNEKYDLLISSLFEYIIRHKKHVRYEHDSNAYLSQKSREQLFKSTVLSIMLSDFHLEMFIKLYGNIFNDTAIILDPISNDFYNFKTGKYHNIQSRSRKMMINKSTDFRGSAAL